MKLGFFCCGIDRNTTTKIEWRICLSLLSTIRRWRNTQVYGFSLITSQITNLKLILKLCSTKTRKFEQKEVRVQFMRRELFLPQCKQLATQLAWPSRYWRLTGETSTLFLSNSLVDKICISIWKNIMYIIFYFVTVVHKKNWRMCDVRERHCLHESHRHIFITDKYNHCRAHRTGTLELDIMPIITTGYVLHFIIVYWLYWLTIWTAWNIRYSMYRKIKLKGYSLRNMAVQRMIAYCTQKERHGARVNHLKLEKGYHL